MVKPTNNELRDIFDGIAKNYEEISNPYTSSRRRDIFQTWAKGDCLEVGAGDGKLASILARTHKVLAIDISPKMVEEIKKKQIGAMVADAEKLPCDNNSLDTVIAAELIYYLDHPENFLAESYRVLRSGGRLLLSSANNLAKVYDRGRRLLRLIGFRHMYFDDKIGDFMSSAKLKKMLEEQGFRVRQEKKIVILPFRAFDWLNKILERSPLNCFGIFIFIMAEK